MSRFVVFPLVVGLVALVGVLLLFVGRFDFDGSGRAFSVDVTAPSSDASLDDVEVVGKSHVDASDELVVVKEEVVKDVVVKEDGNGVVQKDVVKEVVDSGNDVDDDFGFDDVDVGVRGLSFPVVTRFVPGVGELRNGKLSFRHSDRLSSVRLKTAANTAQVTGEFLSLPFGQELVSTNSRLSFATEKELDESGLYFFGARYYDPNIGRFTGVDPVRSNHAYSYVGNNPMNLVDPDGMDPRLENRMIPHARIIDAKKGWIPDRIELQETRFKVYMHPSPALAEEYYARTGQTLSRTDFKIGIKPGWSRRQIAEEFVRLKIIYGLDDSQFLFALQRENNHANAIGSRHHADLLKALDAELRPRLSSKILVRGAAPVLTLFLIMPELASAAETGGVEGVASESAAIGGGLIGASSALALAAPYTTPLLAAGPTGPFLWVGAELCVGACGYMFGDAFVRAGADLLAPATPEELAAQRAAYVQQNYDFGFGSARAVMQADNLQVADPLLSR
ncbi:MAG: RHS repeat-associated core domain-containing protein [Candidatus Woesearchaeota archaeon]|nr:MAG: RHS repeat-associated core domain-containing protein [Candidatus Woesearchaeota archaeon]